MSSRSIVAWFVAAALALALAVMFVERTSPSQAEHQGFTTALAERRQLDEAVAKRALEARFGFTSNYDALARDTFELRRLELESTRLVPSFLSPGERAELEQSLRAYARLSEQYGILLEHFKSQNALLRNSVSYFPVLAAAVLKNVAHRRDLVDQVNELRGLTLTLALHEDPGLVEAQGRSAATVRAMSQATLSIPEQRSIELMLAHARAIQVHKVETDQLLGQILDLPIASARRDVSARYQHAYASAQQLARAFGHCVAGLALVLLGILAYAGLRLRQAASRLRHANDNLEAAVLARTAELKAEMAQKARIEIELRQAQKLEAVGQLASGIAHEINTPIQYVGDSLYFLREAFDDVMRVLDAYGKLAFASGADQALRPALAAVEQLAQDANLEILRAEVPDAFERSVDGTRQVASIVRAMKTFAHTSAEKLPQDLNSALENTLTVARNEYRYVADVETELGALPDVTCNAGGIRQVFLHLIVNAAHAIGDQLDDSGKRGLIKIATRQQGEQVVISVSDTGAGIPVAIRDRVFDPFFTTKEPGRGSGQGLSISQSIVTQHGGKLWFDTELGVGTTFFIQLPIGALDCRDAQKSAHAA